MREITLELVHRHGYVTYSSCAGHVDCEPLAPRHVGLLPRTQAELASMRMLLYAAAGAVNARRIGAVRVRVVESALASLDAWPLPAVDVVFTSSLARDYLADAGVATDVLTAELRSARALRCGA